METICYCFGYSHDDIVRDTLEHRGDSTIVRRITAEKKTGACRCETKNPKHA